MPVERTGFVQDPYRDTEEFTEVASVADRLLEHLKEPGVEALIRAADRPGESSRGVQMAFLPFATKLGFRDESTGLFAAYESAVRPDYYMPLGETGIILEVERGKTVRNNMDFLDFWKCHVLREGSLSLPPRSAQPATQPGNAAGERVRRGLPSTQDLLCSEELHERPRALRLRILR